MSLSPVQHPASADTLYEIKEDAIMRVRTVQGALRFIGMLSFEAQVLGGRKEPNIAINANDLYDMMTLMHTQLQDIQDAEPPLPKFATTQGSFYAAN